MSKVFDEDSILLNESFNDKTAAIRRLERCCMTEDV